MADLTPAALRAKFETLRRDRVLIDLVRSVEVEKACGYIVDVGDEWFVLAYVNDGMWLDGYRCFRLVDIESVRAPSPRADFVRAVLEKRSQPQPVKPPFDLTNLRTLLESSGRAFPLVTIHREAADPEACHIGAVAEVTAETVVLRETGVDAAWDDELTPYRLDEITRIDVDGSYERALHLVGGDAPGEH